MAGSAILSIKILTDASGAKKGLDATASSMDKFKNGMAKAAVPAAIVGAAILKFGNDAVESASRTQQAMGGVEAVFGKNAKTVERWAAGAASSIGLAKSEYGELATVIGSQLGNAGLPLDTVTKKTKGLIQQGADLAAMFGGTTSEAVDALSSAMKGEFDPLEKYGTSLSAAKIKAQQVADGTDKLTGKAASQAKMMATLKLITEQTAKAHGAAAREQDTYAARTQQFSAEIENLKSDLGTALLPIVSALVDKFSGLAKVMSDNVGTVQIVVGIVATLVGIILILNAAMKVATIVTWAMNSAFLANPVVLVTLAIVALIAIVVIAYKKFPAFANIVNTAFAAMKTAVTVFANVVKSTFTTIASVVRSVGNGIQSAWNATGAAITATVRAVGRFLSAAFRAPAAAAGAVISGLGNLAGSVMNGIQSAISKVGAAFASVAGKIKGAFAGAGSWLYNVGASIVQGLINGIDSLVGWVKSKVESLAGMIPGWARKKLGIASPSKVMHVIGQQVSAGLAQGIEDGSAAVADVAKKVADLVAKSMSAMFKNKAQAAKETRDVLKSLDNEYAALRRNANARKAVADSIATLRDQMAQWADQVTSSARQFAGITAAYDLGEGVAMTSDNLAAAMGDRVTQVEQYYQLLKNLRAAGLAQSAIDTLAQAGVEGGMAQAQAIAAGGPAAVAQFNALQARLEAAATTLGTKTSQWMAVAGGQSAQAYLDALLADQAAIESTATKFAAALVAAIRKALRAEAKVNPKKAGGKSTATAVASPALRSVPTGGATATAAATTTGPTFIIQGALDPEGVARSVRRILEGHDRRVGLRVS